MSPSPRSSPWHWLGRARLARAGALLATAVVLASCYDITFSSEYWDRMQADLNKQWGLWQAVAPGHYEYRLSRVCECPEDLMRDVLIEVVDTTIVAVAYADGAGGTVPDSAFAQYFTVKGLFLQIQHAINLRADSLVLRYDSTLHYPREIAGDINVALTGDELVLKASDLVAK